MHYRRPCTQYVLRARPSTYYLMHIPGDLVATLANYENSYVILIKVRCSVIEDTKGQLADRLKALRTCWEGCILEGRAFLAVS